MPAIFGISTFMNMINTTSEILKAKIGQYNTENPSLACCFTILFIQLNYFEKINVLCRFLFTCFTEP